MNNEIDNQQIRNFLITVGQQLESPAEIVLLGGGGLSLLGNTRPTLDLDFNGEEQSTDAVRTLLAKVAKDLQIDLEPVPLTNFSHYQLERTVATSQSVNSGIFTYLSLIPIALPSANLIVAFDSDISDVSFLLREGFVEYLQLQSLISDMADQASKYDLDLNQMRYHLELAHPTYQVNDPRIFVPAL
ncbi:MAG: hypothetical protein R3C44_07875 [Chloroflexota bacterium]